MDSLLKAIRTRLINDATLAATVSTDDITSSFNAEYANYPCIVLSIEGGGSLLEVSGVTKANAVIDIYSDINKQQLWNIYDRVKALLHSQERNITDASCAVHIIYEAKVDDSQYDSARAVWRLVAHYEIMYSTTDLSITTGASGSAYADNASVSAIPSKEIASFRGQVSLNVSFESAVQIGRDRFGKTVHYYTGVAKLTFEEMMFKASVVDLLWNITANVSGALNDGVSSATTYQVSQGSCPSYLQVLFQMTKTDDGKKLEIEAGKAVCHSLSIPFSKTDLSVFDCEWILLGDSSDNVVKVAVEN